MGKLSVIALIAGVVLAGTAEARTPALPEAPTGGPVASSNAAAVADQWQLQGQQQGQWQATLQALMSDIDVSNDSDSRSLSNALGMGGGGGGGGAGTGTSSVVMNGQRQVGMLYLPMMTAPSCGVAVQAGHSTTKNATAFGVSWTTEDCWLSIVAADFERMGAYIIACELRRDIVRKPLKRIQKQRRRARATPFDIDCETVERELRAAIAAAAIAEPQLPAPDLVTQEQLRRAFEASMGKQVK